MASLDELYGDFRLRVESHGWERPIDFQSVAEDLKPEIEYILRRRALAVALHTDEIFSKFSKAAGIYQDTALRLYLLLTCIEIIGELHRGDRFYPFGIWLNVKKGCASKKRNEILQKLFPENSATIETPDRFLRIIKKFHRHYLDIHGFATHFYVFFNECLDSQLRTWILEQCWVYEDDPLTPWAALHMVEPGYSYNNTAELQRLTAARKNVGQPQDRQTAQENRACLSTNSK